MIKFITAVLFFTIYVYPGNDLKEKINSLLSKVPSSTKMSVLIVNPMEEDTLFKYNYTTPMIPASNTKLFTTAVALSVMGGDHELSTKLMSEDYNLKDGSISGNLYIKGYGNSLFTEADLDMMVSELKSKGLRVITGNIIGDDSYFDDVYSRDDWIMEEAANVKLPPVSALVIDRNRTVVYRKKGRRMRSYGVNVDNPPLHAATMLKEKLLTAGITVTGAVQIGVTPSSARALSESKILLRELIKTINKRSDNFLAECLFKTIGAESSKIQGNSFYSTQAVLNYIEDHGIFQKGTAVVDGSGISRYDQVTTGAIVGLLSQVYFDLKIFDDYYRSLSIGGIDGTLRHRFYGSPAENNFHGKTGTLNGVSSLSGYLKTRSGDDLVISIMFEFSKGGANLHRRIEDDIVEFLSTL